MAKTRKREPDALDFKKHVRFMIRRDMPYLVEIEKRSSVAPFSEDEIIRFLGQRNAIGMVCENSREHVVGFMFYQLHNTSLGLKGIAVHPDARLLGVGRTLIDKLKERAAARLRKRIYLRVRKSNDGAHLFFRAMGLQAVGVEREYYIDGEGAYVMKIEVGNT